MLNLNYFFVTIKRNRRNNKKSLDLLLQIYNNRIDFVELCF